MIYRGADKSLARPTYRCILFDGENIFFDASLVLYIYIYVCVCVCVCVCACVCVYNYIYSYIYIYITNYSDRRFWCSYVLFIIIIGWILVLYIYIYIYIYYYTTIVHMNIKIFCRSSLFTSWSGKGLISSSVH
jgi:hypothetical protein